MRHHTKDKGDNGVLRAASDLSDKGYVVLWPMSEHLPFDLVVYSNGIFKRVQVKYKKVTKGVLQIRFESCWADRKGTHVKKVDKNEIDVYCVFCPDTNECYYFDPSEFGGGCSLRVDPPKNKQKYYVRYARDYREMV